MTAITVALIVKESGQYDREVIQRLCLSNQGITSIACLEGCTSLIDLDLSRNKLTSTMGIEVAQSLQRLNLAHNGLRTIEQLAYLTNLESLDLRGNKIDSLSDLSVLSRLTSLKILNLRGVDGEESNPVCSSSSYIKDIVSKIPSLQILDGGHLGISSTFQEVEDYAKTIEESISKQGKSDAGNTTIEGWISDTDKNTILANSEPQLSQQVLDLEKTIEDTLLSKAPSLLQKADEALRNALK